MALKSTIFGTMLERSGVSTITLECMPSRVKFHYKPLTVKEREIIDNQTLAKRKSNLTKNTNDKILKSIKGWDGMTFGDFAAIVTGYDIPEEVESKLGEPLEYSQAALKEMLFLSNTLKRELSILISENDVEEDEEKDDIDDPEGEQ